MLDQREIDPIVEQLIDALCAHLAAHRELADLLEAKERAVTTLDLEQLDEIVERERALINRIGDAEAKRLELVSTIGAIIGDQAPSALRISGIVPYVSTEVADMLLEIRDELRAIADRIDKVADRNRKLIGHSLDHIHLFLSLLSGVDPNLKDYSPHGEAAAPSNPAVLDRRF